MWESIGPTTNTIWRSSTATEPSIVKSKPIRNAVEEAIQQLVQQANGRKIAVCLEKGRVRILYHLIHREEFILYPVDPKQAARYRESFTSSKAKDDRGDAIYLARLLQERIDDMKPLSPDGPLTRRIAHLSENRRGLVNEKTRLIQQLTAKLKLYHPLALMLSRKLEGPLGLEFVRRFADPRKAQKATSRRWRSPFADTASRIKNAWTPWWLKSATCRVERTHGPRGADVFGTTEMPRQNEDALRFRTLFKRHENQKSSAGRLLSRQIKSETTT